MTVTGNNFGYYRRPFNIQNLKIQFEENTPKEESAPEESSEPTSVELGAETSPLDDIILSNTLPKDVIINNLGLQINDGGNTNTEPTDENRTILFSENELKECLQDEDLIKELFTEKKIGDVTCYELKSDTLKNFDKKTIQKIFSTASEYVATQSDVKTEDKSALTKLCINLQVELYNTAQAKNIDAAEYVQLRLGDFMSMRQENPNMSIDEMNEKMALNDVYSTLLDSTKEIFSEVLGTSPDNISDLSDLSILSLGLCNKNPNLRSAYLSIQNTIYLNLAKSGELTNEELYKNLKQDLINIFPNVDSLNDEDYQKLVEKVSTLSLEDVQNFIRQALTVPSSNDEEYQSKLDSFMNSFNSKVSTQNGPYTINNPDEKVDLNYVYKLLSGVDFNADSIITEKAKLSNVNDLIEASTNQFVIENLLSSVECGNITLNNALWQIAYLYTGSTDDKEISKFIKEIVGQDVSVKNGVVSFGRLNSPSRVQATRAMNNKGYSVLNNVKNWCSNSFQNIVDHYVTDSMKKDAGDADFSSAKGCAEYALSLLSNSSFYDSFGNMCLDASLATLVVGGSITAGSAATGAGLPVAAGTGISTSAIAGSLAMLGGVSKAIGGTLEYVQNLIKGNNVSSSTESFLAKMTEAGIDYLGGKYINAVVELPSAVKSVWNELVSKTNSTMNKLMDNTMRVANSENLSSSKVLDALTSNESSWLNTVKDVANTGKYYNKETGQWVNISSGGRSAINQAVKELENGIDPVLRKALQNRKNDVQLVQKYINSSDEEILNALKKEISDTYQPTSLEQMQKEFIEMNPDLDEDMMEELLQEIVDNYSDDSIDRLLREVYNATGKDLTGATKDELINALAQHKLDFIKENKGYVQYLENFLSSQKLSNSVNVVRGEYLEVAKSINIDGKSLDQWLQEANKTGDFTKLLEKLNSGKVSYQYERVAGTSISDAGYKGTFNWNITAPAGTEGFFTDALRNTYGLSEWELLLNKGTKLNVNSAYVKDGQLFLNATVEVVGQDGKTHIKEIAIGMGVAAGASNANANETKPTQPDAKPDSPSNPPSGNTEHDWSDSGNNTPFDDDKQNNNKPDNKPDNNDNKPSGSNNTGDTTKHDNSTTPPSGNDGNNTEPENPATPDNSGNNNTPPADNNTGSNNSSMPNPEDIPLQSDSDIDHSKDSLGSVEDKTGGVENNGGNGGKGQGRTNKWDCGNGYTAHDTTGNGKADTWAKEYTDENGNKVRILQRDTDGDGKADTVDVRVASSSDVGQNGYGNNGYNQNGFNKDGINKDTGTKYDKNGYDKDGYNQNGFNKNGINRDTGTNYDRNGYDQNGYNSDGYDNSGYNKDGYNRDGYDRSGNNKDGSYDYNHNTNLTDEQKGVIGAYYNGDYNNSDGSFDGERFYDDMVGAGFGDDMSYFDGDAAQDVFTALKNGASVDDIFNKYGAGKHTGSSSSSSSGLFGGGDSGYGGGSAGGGYTGHPDNPFGVSDNVNNMLDYIENSVRTSFSGEQRPTMEQMRRMASQQMRFEL